MQNDFALPVSRGQKTQAVEHEPVRAESVVSELHKFRRRIFERATRSSRADEGSLTQPERRALRAGVLSFAASVHHGVANASACRCACICCVFLFAFPSVFVSFCLSVSNSLSVLLSLALALSLCVALSRPVRLCL